MSWQPEGWHSEGWQPGSEPEPAPIYVPPHRTVKISSAQAGVRVLRWAAAKAADEPSRYRLDFTDEVQLRWTRRIYSVGERIAVGGFDADCTRAGLPGWREPRWPLVDGVQVEDGSCAWQIVAPSSASLVQVATVQWVVPDGITVQDKLDGPLSTSAVLLGGEGQVAVVIKVRYGNGEGFDQPCVLQVA